MAKGSKIEWSHYAFNPWWGCERVSATCNRRLRIALAK